LPSAPVNVYFVGIDSDFTLEKAVPMTGPRVRNRRAQILSESSRLFAANGFNGTSIRLIATACGITEAAIYRHFKGKTQLYEEVIRFKAGEHDIKGRVARSAAGLGIEQVLKNLAEYVLELAHRDPELMQLMVNNSREKDPATSVLFKEIRLPLIDHLTAEIAQRIATGEVREVDPVITARCFVGMVVDCALSIGVWEIINRESIGSNAVVANNVPIFARGLLRPSA
jgi:AcrR family transcriptional regulator